VSKKGKKTGVKIVIVLAVVAVFMGAAAFLLEKYNIETVYVEGNVHYTEEEIKSFVMTGPLGNNSLYLSAKYRNTGVEDIAFVDVMDVTILSPDTIKITVYEKAVIGYVEYLDTYMYFDKDGYVVESSGVQTMGIPQVTGLYFDYMVLGQPLPVDKPEVFGAVLDITKLIDKYELMAEKIYFHNTGDVTVYFGNVKVALGNEPDHMEDKVALLPEFLPRLTGMSGVLQMETYDEGSGKYTFKPD